MIILNAGLAYREIRGNYGTIIRLGESGMGIEYLEKELVLYAAESGAIKYDFNIGPKSRREYFYSFSWIESGLPKPLSRLALLIASRELRAVLQTHRTVLVYPWATHIPVEKFQLGNDPENNSFPYTISDVVGLISSHLVWKRG